jgi:hypothetical protein
VRQTQNVLANIQAGAWAAAQMGEFILHIDREHRSSASTVIAWRVPGDPLRSQSPSASNARDQDSEAPGGRVSTIPDAQRREAVFLMGKLSHEREQMVRESRDRLRL